MFEVLVSMIFKIRVSEIWPRGAWWIFTHILFYYTWGGVSLARTWTVDEQQKD